ncbi:MAG: 4Fe-4S binding protein [Opitutaceae bacterium]|jgi:polyferredoxin
MRSHINIHRNLRIVAALAFFGTLTAVLVDFRQLVPQHPGHAIASLQFVPAAVALVTGALATGVLALAVLLLTLLIGRAYCSVICPLGVFQDVVMRLSKWLRPKARPLAFTARRTLWRQVFLWGTLAGVAAGWAGFVLSLIDPYSNYGRIASALFRPLLALANNAVVGSANAVGIASLYRVNLPWPGIGALVAPALFLTLIVIMSALRGRLYCNTVCPVGTILGWVARHAAFRISIDKSACTKCAACFRACKAQCIDLRNSEVDFDRCVACNNCISVCDERGINYRFMWRRDRKTATEPGMKLEDSGAKDPERRALFGRTIAALTLASGFPRQSHAAQNKHRHGQPEIPAAANDNVSVGVSPPGSGSVERFLDRCTACHLCISACPSKVLQPALFEYGLEGFMKPRLDFSAAYCAYDCVRCAEVCPDGAIAVLPVAQKQLQQIGLATFHQEKCIVKTQGTDCAACSEHCPTKAVFTVPYGNNLRMPKVNQALCVGCGACQYVCPATPEKAITVAGVRVHSLAVREVEKPAALPAKPASDFPF